MLQPLPETACLHHTPGGFANSSIAGTLQHIMHVPQVRPGTRCGRSEFANSAAFMGTSGVRGYIQQTQYSVNGMQAAAMQHPETSMVRDIIRLATFAAIAR